MYGHGGVKEIKFLESGNREIIVLGLAAGPISAQVI